MDKDHNSECKFCGGEGGTVRDHWDPWSESHSTTWEPCYQCQQDPPDEPWPCEGHAEASTLQDVGEQYGPEEPEEDRFERFLRTGK